MVAEQAESVENLKLDEIKTENALNEQISNSKQSIEEHKKEFLKKSEGYKNEKTDREKLLQDGASLKMPQKTTLKSCVIICVVICALVMGALLIGIADIASTGEIIGIIVGSVIFCALLILMCKALLPTVNSDHEKNVLEYEKKKLEYEELCKSEPITDEQINEKINTSRAEMNDKIEKEEKSIKELTLKIRDSKELFSKKKSEYKKEGKKIYEALIEQFEDILDSRDWESLDFIIYLLETGRAESKKEALQQLDFHRQTDKIADAVISANKTICETIKIKSQEIEDSIQNCASVISAQLEGINGRLRGLSINSAMQSLLLIKSTMNSNALVKCARSILG